jgi:hypothetical protein
MTRRIALLQWSAFVLVTVMTWLAYLHLWMVGPYYPTLSLLGLISVCLAMWIVRMQAFGRRQVILLAFVLIVAQWWLLEIIILQVVWRLGGGVAR